MNDGNRVATVSYLMEMADEMRKMAQNVFVPSLALIFAMAADEAKNFLENHSALTKNKSEVSGSGEGNHISTVPDDLIRKFKLY